MEGCSTGEDRDKGKNEGQEIMEKGIARLLQDADPSLPDPPDSSRRAQAQARKGEGRWLEGRWLTERCRDA